jgi:hypothetical protein
MAEEDRLRVEMAPPDLEELNSRLLADAPDTVDVRPIHDVEAGVGQEPVTIALIVVGGSSIRAFAKVAQTWIQEREKTRRSAIGAVKPGMKLTLEGGGNRDTVTLEQLAQP